MRLADWLDERPFALAMSSGFFSFFAHTGMLAALTDGGFAPSSVAGSSAGALVGGAWAAGMPVPRLADRLMTLRRDEFWDPAPGAGLLAGRKFDAILRAMLPVTSMRACRVPIAISAFAIAERATHVLRDADLAHAIRASCAVPGMFHPVRVGPRAYWDGGILDRPGLAGIAPGERVLFHHIASRSPWRAKALELPRRADMVTLVLDDLPRSGPFKLDAGRRALELATQLTARALSSDIVDGVVRIAQS
ncbi:MAG TPA: patatin-like phospholipase family protein [Kofleriaceae bacterium]|jgi:NTE family protein|nr:patatin-like phospholipase family protein [Kofleriaceae bacterium]